MGMGRGANSARGGGRVCAPSALPGLFLLAALLFLPARAGAEELTPQEADNRLAIATRMIQGGIYDRAMEIASSVLDDPAARAVSGSDSEIQTWLVRREAARFLLDRGRFGLATSRDEFLDVAESFVHLSNNRYRLQDPVYNVQSAYWAARAYEAAGDYREAVDQYSRVGGITLPTGMEGDAAQRMSRSLRQMAEEIPYPGGMRDRQRRDRLLNQAINELDRARLAFPIGSRRKEIELDLIALRLARRDEQFVREAITEAEAFVESDPAKDELRARAVLYRGQAAAMLGLSDEAVGWFRKVLREEAPSDTDRREAEVGMALAMIELAEAADGAQKTGLLAQASTALDNAIAGAMSPGPWDGTRIVKARVQLNLDQPTAALETLEPILQGSVVNPGAWYAAGMAELRRGRLGEALNNFYPVTRPSNPARDLRYSASREGARTADSKREFGLALALNHQASRMLRRDRLFSSLLVSEFQAMETILKLGKMGGPVSLSGDTDLLTVDSDVPIFSIETKRGESARMLVGALGRLLAAGGDPDKAHDLAVEAEAAYEWSGDGLAKLELAIGMISHLRKRQPSGVTDSILSSRLGESRHALALSRAERILAADAPSVAEIDRTLGDFAAAAASFQEASSGGFSLQDSLDQGMVNMESGAFLMRLADRWDRGEWSALSQGWRQEARQRIEASIRPFNQAIATSGPSSLASRRAKWSRGRALELLGEWRGAVADYLSLMNNSELPRVLRANAARRWAVCMNELGEGRQALTRLAVFAESDAEAALLAGRLSEAAGYPREAYQRYIFAANSDSPGLPPVTPGRVQEAAYRAARLALTDPNEADPLHPAADVTASSRDLLLRNIFTNIGGKWSIPMLELLGDSYLKESDGWRAAYDLAMRAIEERGSDATVDRAMYILAARAMAASGNYGKALDELDEARELLDGSGSRMDAARVTLETARVYRQQDRFDDALRAYTDVFAVYPEADELETAARVEAATMILSRPDAGQRQQEQARGILSGLRDQMQAERILRRFGIN